MILSQREGICTMRSHLHVLQIFLCFYKKIPSPWSTSIFSSDKYRLTFAYLKNQDEFFCTNKTSTITVSVSNGRNILFWVKTSFTWNVLSLGIIFVLSQSITYALFLTERIIPWNKNAKFQNMGLRQELDRLKNENMLLRDKLSKYTDV